MNERTIWILRIAAIFVFLLLAYLLIDLYAKLRRMDDESRTSRASLVRIHEIRATSTRVQTDAIRSGVLVGTHSANLEDPAIE